MDPDTDPQNMDLELDPEETKLLEQLGAIDSFSDDTTITQQLLAQVEQRILEDEQKQKNGEDPIPSSDIPNEINEPSPSTSKAKVPKSSKTKAQSVNQSQSSMLRDLLIRGTKDKSDGADEEKGDSRIRNGEMTPFGSTVEKTVEVDNVYSSVSHYLEQQKRMSQHYKQIKGKKSDGSKSKSSRSKKHQESENFDAPRSSKNSSKHEVKTKTPLKGNILFPKKRAKKQILGTTSSTDPSDSRRRPEASAAEKTSVYINPEEDTDYLPSSEIDSGDQNGNSSDGSVSFVVKQKKQPRKSSRPKKSVKKKRIIERSSSDDEEDYDSTEYETDNELGSGRPTKRRRKEGDDGDISFYKERVKSWKESETRFTDEVHSLEGGFKLPGHIWNSLYSYQKTGVKWLWELHNQRAGGILGDEMGLGKTIQVICFLAGLACSNMQFRFTEFRGLGPTLIVCPATVMHQWVKEFHKWWPPFRVGVLHESGSYSGSRNSFVRSMFESQGILISSYSGIVNNQNEILKFNWHYVILDEGHKIRNPDALVTVTVKQIRTPHRIILSGSPLQNNLKELWSLFDFIFPGKLGTLPTFMEHFSVPITHGGYSNASEIQVATAYKCACTLRDLISPYLLRRLKVDVNKHLNLPEKTEQVLFCKLTDEQKSLYQKYLKSDLISGIIKGRYNLFVGLISLRKICNHPDLFDGNLKLEEWKLENEKRKRQNPVEGFEEDEGDDIEINQSDSFGHWSKSGKMVVVRTLLKLWKRQNHKVLLFSQSRQMLCILENFILQEGYSYLRMDGSTSIGSRQPMITKFNSDPNMFIFLATTKVGGLGVNLTGANRVIIFDPDWNPSTDLQARERAWRIGQERQVTIYRLITSGSIEEKIYHRQIFKQFLTNRVLKDPKQNRFFKSNDMMELFTLNEGTQGKGTETEAIFAGTDTSVPVPRKRKRGSSASVEEEQPREKSSGKLRGIPNLIKQKPFKASPDPETEETPAINHTHQNDYVLRKLFKRSGVEAALKHDKIMDSGTPDYVIVEKEAERVAKDAIRMLKESRRQCWEPETGKVSFTGKFGSLRKTKRPVSATPAVTPVTVDNTSTIESERTTLESFFSSPQLPSNSNNDLPMSSKDMMAIIMNSQRPLIQKQSPEGEGEPENTVHIPNKVKSDELELLRSIREFIAFQSKVNGQATSPELVANFGSKLPPKDSPLFKKMLQELCTNRKVDDVTIWRLKPEFR